MQHDRLERFADRLRTEPGFISYELRTLGREEIADQLRIDQADVTRLLLCRTPRSDRTAADIEQIAAYVGTDAGTLGALLRQPPDL